MKDRQRDLIVQEETDKIRRQENILEIAKIMMAAEITGLRAKFGMNYIDYNDIASISVNSAIRLMDAVKEMVE